ncbi:Copper-binding lipoprotein NosL (fragment) [Methylocella tundrae]|uniref:Copper-binding lipoprotein NosL n=1 Tax=Methylocella tundrae TaxID=227605 RepID=A0A4U8Z5Y5_METTU
MRHIFIVLALLSLTACKEDKAADLPLPREVTDASVAQFCGMALREHAGPKAQIFVRGVADPYWFSTVRDAFAFAMLPEMPKSISAIYVNDMARAKGLGPAGAWHVGGGASGVLCDRQPPPRRHGRRRDDPLRR